MVYREFYMLKGCRETTLQHLSQLRPAPSVGLQDVPRESMGEHLGFSSRQMRTDDTDEKLARKYSISCRLPHPTHYYSQKICG